MAFDEQRGNHWLLIPAIGVVLMFAAHYDCLPEWLGSKERVLGYGLALTIVGIVCAGLIGHIIWLLPFALLLVSPLILLLWIQEKYTDRRHKDREVNGSDGIVRARIADEPSDPPKSPAGHEMES